MSADFMIYECVNCLQHRRVYHTAAMPNPFVCVVCGGGTWRVVVTPMQETPWTPPPGAMPA